MIFNRYLLWALLGVLGFSGSASAQAVRTVTGILIDTARAPVSDANVVVVSGNDTLKTSSDKNGGFSIKLKDVSEFEIIVSHVGFSQYRASFKVPSGSGRIELEKITLKIYAKMLAEVLVKKPRRPIIIKKDTTEYDVDHFKLDDDEMLELLLKRLPGLSLNADGDLMAEGKKITRLRINGQDFFSGNLKEFIKKLPTGIFSKLQIINDFGADAAFSGIKTNRGEKVVNLVTKPGMDKGIFGNVFATAGTNELIGGNANGNFWEGVRQISGDVNLQKVTNTVGSGSNNKIDLRYNDQIGKNIKFGLNYNLNKSRSSDSSNTYSEAVTPTGLLNNQTTKTSFRRGSIPTFGVNGSYQPDQMTSVRLTGGYNQNRLTDSAVLYAKQTGLINQELNSGSFENNKNSAENLNLALDRKLGRTGRVITVNFQYKANSTEGTIRTYRTIRYNGTFGNFTGDSIFNSLATKAINASVTDIAVAYTEPLSTKSNLDVIYNYTNAKQRTAIITNNILNSGSLFPIDSLSSQFRNSTSSQKAELNYRLENDKITFVGGFNLQRIALSGIYSDGIGQVDKKMSVLSPKLNLTYNPTNATGLELNYAAETAAPAVEELQPVPDVSDIQNIYVGNPNLKPSNTHQLELNLRHFTEQSSQLLNVGVTASLVRNKIVSNTVIIRDTSQALQQLTRYINANGSYRVGAHYDFSRPLKIFALTASTSYSGSIDFGNDIIYADNVRTENTVRTITQTIKTVIPSKHLNTGFTFNYSGVSNHYRVGSGLTSYVSAYTFVLNENAVFGKYTLFANASKSFNSGYANINPNNPLIVNMTFSRLFMNQNLQASLQVTDLLNQSSRISQATIGNSIVNNRTNYISRFFILGLNYKISRFGHF